MSSFFNLRQNRINDPENVDLDLIDRDMNDGKHVIVQFSKPTYTESLLSTLDYLCKKYDRQFGIRFYGHYGGVFDCKVLRHIPNVRCLDVGIHKAENIKELTKLGNLEALFLGIYEMKESDILEAENFRLLSLLGISETKSKTLIYEIIVA